MGATASVPARDSAKRALWERLCSLDDACKAVQSRSGAASEEVRARRRLINGAQSVLHRLRAALSASEAVDNANLAVSTRRQALSSFALASSPHHAAANEALDEARRETDRTLVAWREAVAAVAVQAAGVARDAARMGASTTCSVRSTAHRRG